MRGARRGCRHRSGADRRMDRRSVLGALALWSGLGWLAALAAYSFGGSVLLVLLAALPALEPRAHAPALRPALVRRSRG